MLRFAVSAVFMMTLVIGTGCAPAPDDELPASSQSDEQQENSAGEVEGRQEDPAAGEVLGETTAMGFNDCACLDPSQVKDCRSGTCYCSRPTGQSTRLCCYISGTCAYTYLCPQYEKYVC